MMMSARIRRIAIGVISGILLLLALAGPFAVNGANEFLFETIAVEALFATSVALLWGTGNIPSFGQIMFFGVGAYVTAELATNAPGLPMPVVILASIAAAGVAGVLTGLVSMRSRGVAFSMVTLAISQAVYLLAFTTNIVGGENGISGIIAPMGMTGLWYVTIGCAALGVAGYYLISVSPFAQALRAIKDDAKRMSCLGVSVRRYELVAFILASLGAGLAGSLFAYINAVVTTDTLHWTGSGLPIIMLLVGGMGSFWGASVGTVVIELATQYLQQFTTLASTLVTGLILLSVLIWFPKGILGITFGRRKGRQG